MKKSASMRLKIFIVCLITQSIGIAQEIKDIAFTDVGGLINITYFLRGDYPDQTFDVKIFTSVDDYKKPLEFIQGDANQQNIRPGEKEVVWDARKEYKLYEGMITFKVVAKVISNFSVFYPAKDEVFKRGRTVNVKWKGFRPGSDIKLTLVYPDGEEKWIGDSNKDGNYKWVVDNNIKPGKGCKIRVEDKSNINNIAHSGQFDVKRKFPLGASIGIGAAVVAGVVIYILMPEPVEPLPLPPDPEKQAY